MTAPRTRAALALFVFLAAILWLPSADDGTAQAQSRYLTGFLLVASPEMADPRFHHAVIFVVKHDDSGALGLIVNRAMGKLHIADVVAGLDGDATGLKGDIEIFYGGPVEPRRAFVLYSNDYSKPPLIPVTKKYSVTINTDILRAIATGKGPGHSILTIGYAGWGKGQLEAELKRRDWFIAPASDDILFDADQDTKWQRAYDRRMVGI